MTFTEKFKALGKLNVFMLTNHSGLFKAYVENSRLIGEAHNKLVNRVGKERADELITEFSKEAQNVIEPSHSYIVRKMDEVIV